jgi:hypothetical protein
LEQLCEGMLEPEELLVFFVVDDSTAKSCAATEMPEEELIKHKILHDWIAKKTNNNGARFLRCAAENESTTFSQWKHRYSPIHKQICIHTCIVCGALWIVITCSTSFRSFSEARIGHN